MKATRKGTRSAVARDGVIEEPNASGDERFEDLRERYAAQVAPAFTLSMLRHDSCRRTFFAGLDRDPSTSGNHHCGTHLRSVLFLEGA